MTNDFELVLSKNNKKRYHDYHLSFVCRNDPASSPPIPLWFLALHVVMLPKVTDPTELKTCTLPEKGGAVGACA